MKIVRFKAGDRLRMKKSHPCGSDIFQVMYAGTDVKIRCLGCGREVITDRIKLEKNIKTVEPNI